MEGIYTKPKDGEDLKRAKEMIDAGRKLRLLVQARIRQRRWRDKHTEKNK